MSLEATPSEYPAALYLAVHSSDASYVDFYRRVCAGVSRVLELGCGAGTISCALAADGREVVGLDRRPALLERARACKGVRFASADMRRFALPDPHGALQRFDRIIAPYRTLYCLLDEHDLCRCLERIRAHLAPEGLLVFDGWNADIFHAEADPTATDDYEHVSLVEVAGRRFDVYERSEWERARQRIDAYYRHVAQDNGELIEARIAQRYLRSAQVAPLLERAGLSLVAMLGDFDQEAFHEDSEQLIVVARPAPGSVP